MSKGRIFINDEFVLKDKRVGIGTTYPEATLHVVGDIIIDGASTFTGVSSFSPFDTLTANSLYEKIDGIQYPVVSQIDIGTDPNQVPLNGFLGNMAYSNYPFAQVGISSADSDVLLNAPTIDLYSHQSSFTNNRTIQIANLTSGNEVKLYIKNTNSSQRVITIQASETTSNYSNVNLAPGGSVVGGPSTSTVNLASTSGTVLIWVANIGGDIVGGIMA